MDYSNESSSVGSSSNESKFDRITTSIIASESKLFFMRQPCRNRSAVCAGRWILDAIHLSTEGGLGLELGLGFGLGLVTLGGLPGINRYVQLLTP